MPNKNSETCSICYNQIRSDTYHLCSNCERRSHAKCNDTEPKFIKNLWLCKLCKTKAFPFCDLSEQLPIGKDISSLKSYFNHLNSMSDKFSNFDFDTDESDFDDHVAKINCKYYNPDDFISLPSKKKSLSCFHLNITSLDKHFDNLYSLLSKLNHQFDILGITETRFQSPFDSSSSNISFHGYKHYDTPAVTSVGGTALYISESYNSKPRLDLSKLVFSDSGNLESTFAEICLTNRKNIIVGCIYKHPHMDIDLFNNEFLSPLLKKTSKENKTIILLGDFNINLLSCNTEISHSNFLDRLGEYQILPAITLPTRITDTSSTLIDNIFVSPTNYSSISGNLTVAISDHLPQFLILNTKTKTVKKEPIQSRRDWSKYNEAAFKEDFENTNWEALLELEKSNVEFSFDSFITRFSSLYDKHVPIKQLTKRQSNLLSKSWITKGLLTL